MDYSCTTGTSCSTLLSNFEFIACYFSKIKLFFPTQPLHEIQLLMWNWHKPQHFSKIIYSIACIILLDQEFLAANFKSSAINMRSNSTFFRAVWLLKRARENVTCHFFWNIPSSCALRLTVLVTHEEYQTPKY